jgi:hypothetical protein
MRASRPRPVSLTVAPSCHIWKAVPQRGHASQGPHGRTRMLGLASWSGSTPTRESADGAGVAETRANSRESSRSAVLAADFNLAHRTRKLTVRMHLRRFTPAMTGGLADHVWTIRELLVAKLPTLAIVDCSVCSPLSLTSELTKLIPDERCQLCGGMLVPPNVLPPRQCHLPISRITSARIASSRFGGAGIRRNSSA